MLVWRPANAILTTMTKALLQLAGSGEECQVFPWEGKPLLYARRLSEPRDLVIDDALFGGREPLADYDQRLWDADIIYTDGNISVQGATNDIKKCFRYAEWKSQIFHSIFTYSLVALIDEIKPSVAFLLSSKLIFSQSSR